MKRISIAYDAYERQGWLNVTRDASPPQELSLTHKGARKKDAGILH
jgi:hypothetical protein